MFKPKKTAKEIFEAMAKANSLDCTLTDGAGDKYCSSCGNFVDYLQL